MLTFTLFIALDMCCLKETGCIIRGISCSKQLPQAFQNILSKLVQFEVSQPEKYISPMEISSEKK